MLRCFAIVCVLLLQACASTATIQTARSQYYSGQAELALETLDEVESDSKSRLLVEFDRGAILFSEGRYRDSSKALLRASKLLDELDIVRVSEQTTSLLTNDWALTYKGEYSERLWVHALQMMNFLLLNEAESAAVEARQAIKLMEKHADALKSDWFTRSLIALSFEAVGQLDSAHIEYQKLHNDAQQSGIAHLAWNNAKRLGRESAVRQLAEGENFSAIDSAIVLFVHHGRIPGKLPGEIFLDEESHFRFPVYANYDHPTVGVSISLNDEPIHTSPITTNLFEVAKASLSARGKQIAAKTALRAATKSALRKEARDEDRLLGAFVSAALYILEFPDIRGWETLPAQLTLAVIPVEPGTHSLTVNLEDNAFSRQIQLDDITVEHGQRVFRIAHPQNSTASP